LQAAEFATKVYPLSLYSLEYKWSGVRAKAGAKMHMHVHYLSTFCMLDQYPTILGIVTLCCTLYIDVLSLPWYWRTMVHFSQSTGTHLLL